jgi:hypothetical protein
MQIKNFHFKCDQIIFGVFTLMNDPKFDLELELP